ncbi:beta-1,3-galactosyl-O-glycosyl-glycoprotein beta-1,6-N-acetylglucosaminyltransferase 3-like [Liolophura sinensis]|uniref:beta-1,3-galactosyl-O-glycosyl-glycoprotein beta-1,6-N-acetylglucosaminyltransferase 3-like n=1 Tax=Liolophura sinensis TaxID=3198878 RepID=UPI0031585514
MVALQPRITHFQAVLVHWGTFSVLDADLICMRELLRFKWKYFINLTGQEFPLQTNKQVVQILKAYRGANGIKGSVSRFDKRRVKNKGPPPFNITLMKGPVHIAASRAFVEFIFSDKKTQIFLEWLKDTVVPDETFYATINYNPHLSAPGGFNGPVQVRENMPFILRYKQWNGQKCSGKHVRDICIFNVGDLSDLANSKALFANKFHRTYGQYAYDCLEELHWNRTIQEYFSGEEFNTSFYSSLSEVKYRNQIKSLI